MHAKQANETEMVGGGGEGAQRGQVSAVLVTLTGCVVSIPAGLHGGPASEPVVHAVLQRGAVAGGRPRAHQRRQPALFVLQRLLLQHHFRPGQRSR